MASRPQLTSLVNNQSESEISDSGMYTESEHSDSEYHRASVAIASLPSDTTTINPTHPQQSNPQNSTHTTNISKSQQLTSSMQMRQYESNNINNYQSPHMQLPPPPPRDPPQLPQTDNNNIPPPKTLPTTTLNQSVSSDYHSLSRKKRKKRVSHFSHNSIHNLLNTARSLSSYKSRAITKIKNKSNNDMYKDCIQIKQNKRNLKSFNTMNNILSTSQKLYSMQLKHIDAMKQFSSTIHSTIDLGCTVNGKSNYFGKYLKMMASTVHSTQQIYDQYTSNFNKFLIEPLEIITESSNLQLCKNYRYEYSKIKHAYNSNPTMDKKLELENIEEKFMNATNKLIAERDKSLRFGMDKFQQSFHEFAEKEAKYISNQRVIDGYDEMKVNKSVKYLENKTQNLIKEMTYIHSDKEQQFDEYINKYKYCIVLFHRDKFPPSMKFLIDIFAPLSVKYNNNKYIEFINIHYQCTDILDKYNVNSFPTCLVFINGILSDKYKPIVGNGNIQRNELESIVKEIIEKINKLKPIVQADIVSMNDYSLIQISK